METRHLWVELLTDNDRTGALFSRLLDAFHRTPGLGTTTMRMPTTFDAAPCHTLFLQLHPPSYTQF